MEVKSFIGVDDAIRKITKYGPRRKGRKFPVLDSVGRYSFLDILSDQDFPPFDRSAVDGYALNSDETISSSKNNPSRFKLSGKVFPSSKDSIEVRKGEAVGVTTGARIPRGADSVVMLEDTSEKDGEIEVFVPLRKFQNVSRKGEDLKKGFRILRKGEKIYPPHVAALLECGIEDVQVISFSIGIISTGDEVVSGEVRNSTQPMLHSFFQRKGFDAVSRNSVGDDEREIEKALDSSKEDVIVVTGGTGPGERDVMPSVIEENGKMIFRGLKMRPGRTTSFGIYKGKPVFMVSGLPVAALIASENVILPVIRNWLGIPEDDEEIRSGILGRSLVNTLGFRSYVRVRTERKGKKTFVYPTRVTGSGVIYSVIGADGLLVMDESSEGIGEGESVNYRVLRW